MGAICNQVENKTFGSLEEAADNSTKQHYEPATIQDIPYLQNRVEALVRTNEKFHNFEEGRQLLKHKTKDIYYFGDWDVNGYQKGPGILYKTDDYFYYGDFDTAPNGKGVYESRAYKYIYEGDFSFGRIQGEGKFYSTEDLFSYEGSFNSKSEPVTGRLTIKNPQNQAKSYTVYFDHYPENFARIINQEGRQYEGEISLTSFVPHGKGKARYVDHSIYSGNWENGEFHGQGKFEWKDGSSYDGHYVNGKKHGKGNFTYASKKVYKGDWVNGKQEGEGVLYDQHGDVSKKGHWKSGVYEQTREL